MPKSDINNKVNKGKEISWKTGTLSIEEVISLLPPAYREVYKDRVEIQNYNQIGSYFYRLSEREILDKITEKALEVGLDPIQKRAFRKGSDIYKSYLQKRKGPKHEYKEENEPGPEIRNPSVEMVDYIHPLISEFIESLKARGCILEFLNVDKTRAVNIDREMKAIYIVTLRVQSNPNSDIENLNVSNSDIIIQAYPENVRIYNPSLPGKARKVEFDVQSTISQAGIHIGPVTDKDAVASLEQLGLIMDRNVAIDVFRKAIGAFIKTGNAEVLDGIDAPGFYSNGKGGIYAVGYQVREVKQEEMKITLGVLNKIALLFPKSIRRFATVVRWSLSSPFSYYLKQNKIYPQHLMLYGMTGTSKTALLLLNHGIWGKWDPESSNHGFFVSGGETDTPARLGERLEQGTFALVIDEGEGLFLKSDGRENVPVIGILKHALQSLISRQTSDRGKFQALASVSIATNVKPPKGAAPILSRMATFESTSAEQIHLSTGDKERFQKLQNEFYPMLEPIGQYVAAKILEDPTKLSSDFEVFGESMLNEVYNFAGLEVPEWVSLRMDQTSIENIDIDIKEEIRVFLYKSNLDAYSRNIGRTGVLQTSAIGNEYPEYDERTNVRASKKIEISVKSGLISWQVYKDTKGLEQVILTTAFAKEISRIIGEAYNLQSIGELLGFETKFVRTGKNTAWALVSKLEMYLKFVVPEVTLEPGADASKILGDLRTLKTNNPYVNEPSTIEESKEKIEKPWKTSDESKFTAIPDTSKDKTDKAPNEDLTKNEQVEKTMDPVLKHLIDCTFNSTKKFKTVHELFRERPLGTDWSEAFIYQHLEKEASKGIIVRKGTGYGYRDLVEGAS